MTLTQLLKNRVFLFVILIGMLEPRCVGELSVYRGGIWTIWHRIDTLLIYAGILFILAVSLFLFHKISMIALAVGLYQAWWIFSDLYNGVSISSDLRLALKVIALVLLVDIACKLDFKKQLLEVMSFVLAIFILINFITIIMYPDGMYTDNRNWTANWFFGYKNSHIYVYLLYMACCAIKDTLKLGYLSMSYYVMVALMLVSSYLADTSTTTIILIIMTAMIVFLHSVKLPKWINGATAMVASAILSALFVFLNIQTYFNDVINMLFQKDATFSNRVSIWSVALLRIIEEPIIGNGNSYVSTTLFSTWDVTQCHNYFLDILFVGGIVLMGLFILIQFLTCSKLIKDGKGIQYNIMTFVWIGYAILFLMEARRNDAYIYIIYALAYNIRYFNISAEGSELKDSNKHIYMNHGKLIIRTRRKQS